MVTSLLNQVVQMKHFSRSNLLGFILLLCLVLSSCVKKECFKKEYIFVCYSHKYHQPIYVKYQINSSVLIDSISRSDNFRVDTLVDLNLSLKDYKNSGFDRGHLKPAASSKGSEEEMSESFFLSNISPQYPRFNREVWKKIESFERSLLDDYDSLIIYTGNTFNCINNQKLNNSKIRIPKKVFKTIMTSDSTGISFVCPNKADVTYKDITVLSIEELESLIKEELYPGYSKFSQAEVDSVLKVSFNKFMKFN